MPQTTSWAPLLKEWVEKENDCFGVYYLSDVDETVLYIGSGHILTNLRSRMEGGENHLKHTVRFRVEYAGSLRQANINLENALKEHEQTHRQLPKYNREDASHDSVKVVENVV